jgi:hypothetical protein
MIFPRTLYSCGKSSQLRSYIILNEECKEVYKNM